jgi:hypothetical protein
MWPRDQKGQPVLLAKQVRKENAVYPEQLVHQAQKENKVKLAHKAYLVRRVRRVPLEKVEEYVVVHPPVILPGS